ncbi:HTH-type transcriptional repressor of iron proteins A [Marinomonas aquimarina]|uniref:HTH-type transcriptional repressor of iron proteins A n=1 Tax=Marinomonas aquimarina TaxID=295068 RepID=A0A1A8TE06_9GAMM|nr:helix-turn-helix transcriptional regulator [Marinomonas aquimarina]SBS31115.1 HTH-type transcriptional repressor of iron proteins A [Marinomonas aquimarina]
MPKFRQPERHVITDFGPADRSNDPLITERAVHRTQVSETPWHVHQKGQLILTLSGSVTSYVEQSMWLVPPLCAVWVPGEVVHRNTFDAYSDVCMVFIDGEHASLPDAVCTLSISPLVRELIVHIAQLPSEAGSPARGRLQQVLIDLLEQAPREAFDFPLPEEPRLNDLARRLLAAPHDRRTLSDWAQGYNMSERTLARLIKQKIHLTFGQWRGQLHIVLALEGLAQHRPIQRIAEDLGYESVSAFITFFKKQLGCTPKQYQQQRWGA